jgi:hypothetical protein
VTYSAHFNWEGRQESTVRKQWWKWTEMRLKYFRVWKSSTSANIFLSSPLTLNEAPWFLKSTKRSDCACRCFMCTEVVKPWINEIYLKLFLPPSRFVYFQFWQSWEFVEDFLKGFTEVKAYRWHKLANNEFVFSEKFIRSLSCVFQKK